VYSPRIFPVYRFALCGTLSTMKFGLRYFDRSLASGFAADGSQARRSRVAKAPLFAGFPAFRVLA
jgi:hypothetical protein